MLDDLTASRRNGLFAVVTVALVAALAAGCGVAGTNSDSSGAQPSRAERPAKGPAATRTAPTPGSSRAPEASDTQLIAYTASLDVRVHDVAAGSSRADAVVTAAGGYVERQRARGERPASAYATTTYRVPAARYRSVLARLGRLGTRLSLSQRADNVTEDVADVGARAKAAQASLDRLRTLMRHATDVREVLSIETQVSQRESELEALQARQRALDTQVRYATITLALSGPHAAPPKRETGLLAGLRAGWHGLLVFLTGLLTVVGAVLPFLLVVAPLGALAYVVRRRRRRKAAAAPVSG
ncbi:MAG: DUF4349 domain-containing protein [Streptosporangiales bacterium]|nr:DUF4349 domain-containing protein [Streptosporangiales bacterium]